MLIMKKINACSKLDSIRSFGSGFKFCSEVSGEIYHVKQNPLNFWTKPCIEMHFGPD